MRFSEFPLKIWWFYCDVINRIDTFLQKEMPNIIALVFLGSLGVLSLLIFFSAAAAAKDIFQRSNLTFWGAFAFYVVLFVYPVALLFLRAKTRRAIFLKTPYSKNLYKSKENDAGFDL